MTQNLGKVGIVDKGIFDINKIYNQCDFVYFKGSTWLALKDNLLGVEPTESENWKYLAKGVDVEFLNGIPAIDTQGLLGNAGATTDAQSLVDAILKVVIEQGAKKETEQEIEYINEGSVLALCEKKQKSFRFIAYNSTAYGANSIIDIPPSFQADGSRAIWNGEFLWMLPMYENSHDNPPGIGCILKMRNLVGEEFVNTGWVSFEGYNQKLTINWMEWMQIDGCSVVVNKDVHDLPSGKYFVLGGINLPSKFEYADVEVNKRGGIDEILCRHGANMYIKQGSSSGEWRCLSSDKTMPVYVGNTPPEDTNVLWVW